MDTSNIDEIIANANDLLSRINTPRRSDVTVSSGVRRIPSAYIPTNLECVNLDENSANGTTVQITGEMIVPATATPRRNRTNPQRNNLTVSPDGQNEINNPNGQSLRASPPTELEQSVQIVGIVPLRRRHRNTLAVQQQHQEIVDLVDLSQSPQLQLVRPLHPLPDFVDLVSPDNNNAPLDILPSSSADNTTPSRRRRGNAGPLNEIAQKKAREAIAESELLCAICMESYSSRNPTATKCGHIFCNVCINRALQQNGAKCPICRTKTSQRHLIRIHL